MDIKLGISGRYKMEVYRPDGTIKTKLDWFPNLITNNGLDLFCSANITYLQRCKVGSGNTAPLITDTTLDSFIGEKHIRNSYDWQGFQSSPPTYVYWRGTYRFEPGDATGNLSEVGMGIATGDGSNLFSRALILNSEGAPTTITILSDETLDITYELRLYHPADDISGSFVVSGTTHDYVGRVSYNANWEALSSFSVFNATYVFNGTIGDVTGQPSGTIKGASPHTVSSYSNGTYYRDVKAEWSLANGNMTGGISAMRAECYYGRIVFQYSVDPIIAKNSTKELSLNFRWFIGRKELPHYKTVKETGLGTDGVTVTT